MRNMNRQMQTAELGEGAADLFASTDIQILQDERVVAVLLVLPEIAFELILLGLPVGVEEMEEGYWVVGLGL